MYIDNDGNIVNEEDPTQPASSYVDDKAEAIRAQQEIFNRDIASGTMTQSARFYPQLIMPTAQVAGNINKAKAEEVANSAGLMGNLMGMLGQGAPQMGYAPQQSLMNSPPPQQPPSGYNPQQALSINNGPQHQGVVGAPGRSGPSDRDRLLTYGAQMQNRGGH